MLNTNLDWYEKLTAEQVWDNIDPNYNIEAGSTVYRSETEEFIVMISQPYNCDEWCCEIERAEDGEYSDGFGSTPEQALTKAIVELVGYEVLQEEDNCEDASNGIAYEAYTFAYGAVPMFEMDAKILDDFMGAACDFVKKNGERFGIEWEEYRW